MMENRPEDFIATLRERVGPLTLQLPSMDVVGLGTCFVIGAMGGAAIAVTAAHCLLEAAKHDVPDRVASAPGSPFQIERSQLAWNAIELGTNLANSSLPSFMSLPVQVDEAYWNKSTDIAFLLVAPVAEYRESCRLDRQIGLCSSGPVVGEKVIVVGFFDTEVVSSHHRSSDGKAAFQVTRGKFQVVEATVVAVFSDGVRDLNWPCFKLDCPLFSGMSGGCVLVKRASEFLAAGVISRDLSVAAVASGLEAFAAILQPALDTSFPARSYQRQGMEHPATINNILDLIELGVITDGSSKGITDRFSKLTGRAVTFAR